MVPITVAELAAQDLMRELVDLLSRRPVIDERVADIE